MSKFSMDYCVTKEESVAPHVIHMEVDEDANLRQHFLAFVNMTRMMGFHPGSWEKILSEGYHYCVKHDEASKDYDIYLWAADDLEDTF